MSFARSASMPAASFGTTRHALCAQASLLPVLLLVAAAVIMGIQLWPDAVGVVSLARFVPAPFAALWLKRPDWLGAPALARMPTRFFRSFLSMRTGDFDRPPCCVISSAAHVFGVVGQAIAITPSTVGFARQMCRDADIYTTKVGALIVMATFASDFVVRVLNSA